MATSQECNCATTERLKYLDLSSAGHDQDDGKKRKSHNHNFFNFHKHKHEKNGNQQKPHNKEIKSGTDPKTQEDHKQQDTEHQPQTAEEHPPKDEEQKPKDEAAKDHEKDKSHHLHFTGLGFKPMVNCLDFRTRTVSFDLHNIGQNAKMSLLSKLLHRSKSESSMKVPPKKKDDKEGHSSPTGQSPKQSPGAAPRRRFVRVVRDDQCLGEEYVNPHVTRRFSKNHWEKNFLKKSASLDEGDDHCRPLPYTVTGHTILKKHHSVDSDSLCCSDINKHAKFNEEVEVLEYDIKGKILAIHSDASILHAKLHSGEIVHEEVVLSRDACDAISVEGIEVELPTPACVMLEVIAEATTPTDLSPDSPDSEVTDTTVLTEGLTTRTYDSDDDAEDLVSDSVFDETTDSEHVPKASRQISADEECSVKKSKLESSESAKSIDTAEEKLKEVES